MSCYQVVLVSVEFKVESAERLKKALEKLGISVNGDRNGLTAYFGNSRFRFDLINGEVNFQVGQEYKINEIKREYSKVSLEEITKKNKWFLKIKAANKFQVVKY